MTVVVAPGAGARLGDRWAGVAAGRMVEETFETVAARVERMNAFLNGPYGEPGANDRAVTRWRERACKALGAACATSSHMAIGRAQYCVSVDHFATGRLPGGPRIVLVERLILERKGRGKALVVKQFDVGGFSRHALARLVQRFGVTDTSDMLGCLRSAWPSIVGAAIGTKGREHGATLIVPAEIRPGVRGYIVAVDWDRILVAKTFLTRSMVADADQLDTVAETLAHGVRLVKEGRVAELKEAAAACREGAR